MLDAIASVAGQILGREIARDDAEDARHAVSQQQAQNIALQREFAQNGITWRVEDAKRAGLHPLYAIGGSGAAFAPNPVVVGGGSGFDGQNLSRAAMASLDPHARALQQAQLKVLEAAAEKDFALAAAARSEAARGAQGGAASVPIPLLPPPSVGDELDVTRWMRGRVESPENSIDAVRAKPDDITSVVGTEPYRTAASNKPFYSEHRFSNDFSMLLPAGSSPSEAIEALGESPLTALMVVQQNMDHYGPGWGRKFAKQFPGLRSLVEAGEELAPLIERLVKRNWSTQEHKSVMPAAIPEFSETRRPEWYGGRAGHGSVRRRWR